MRGTYIVEKTSIDKPEYFNTYAYESNKKRSIQYAQRLIAQGKKARVKIYLSGKIIYP